jgi:hypothetical protein
MGVIYDTYVQRWKKHTKTEARIPEGRRAHLRPILRLFGRIILKWILKK